jgi:signal transduction histidine kinase
VPLDEAVGLVVLAAFAGGVVVGHLMGRIRSERRARLQSQELAAATEARISDLMQVIARLRHDVRGALSPALLAADRLLTSRDAATHRAAEICVTAIERANTLLDATRASAGGAPHQAPDVNDPCGSDRTSLGG